MPAEITEHTQRVTFADPPATAKADVLDHRDDRSPQTDPAPEPVPPTGQSSVRRRRLLMGGAGVVVLVVALVFGIPWIRFALNTVSTDDAFVSGHVTFVAPRVRGQVSRVLVDDNNRVHKGDLLVELDKEPFQDAVAVKQAAVDTAEADLQAARATARGIEAQARSRRWQLQEAVENVDNQISGAACPGRRAQEGEGHAYRSRSRSSTGRRSWSYRRRRAASSMTSVRHRCRLPRRASSRHWRMRTRPGSLGPADAARRQR